MHIEGEREHSAATCMIPQSPFSTLSYWKHYVHACQQQCVRTCMHVNSSVQVRKRILPTTALHSPSLSHFIIQSDAASTAFDACSPLCNVLLHLRLHFLDVHMPHITLLCGRRFRCTYPHIASLKRSEAPTRISNKCERNAINIHTDIF